MNYTYECNHCCPKCFSENIKKVRIKYCFPNDSNPIDCECKNCGHKWGERD